MRIDPSRGGVTDADRGKNNVLRDKSNMTKKHEQDVRILESHHSLLSAYGGICGFLGWGG